jgi:hypothetical protein
VLFRFRHELLVVLAKRLNWLFVIGGGFRHHRDGTSGCSILTI